MKRLSHLSFICSLLFLNACDNHKGFSRIPVEFNEPLAELSVAPDGSHCFQESLHCLDLQVVRDSFLVINRQIDSKDSSQYAVFSSSTFEYLGGVIPKGRGPEEFLSPHLGRTTSDASHLFISDNSIGKAFSVDIEESIVRHNSIIATTYHLPQQPVDWIPLDNTNQLCLWLDNKELIFSIIKQDEVVCSFHPYKDIDATVIIPKLSCLPIGNGKELKFAIGLVCFPMVLLFDYQSNTILSVAVDKDYRNWRSIINEPFNQHSVQYYAGITSSSDYIIASYWKCTLEETMTHRQESEIHIFDWNGNYLYRLFTHESIGNMAFDAKNCLLYCIDTLNSNVLRYNLSFILKQ